MTLRCPLALVFAVAVAVAAPVALRAPLAADPAMRASLHCVGEEPFWALDAGETAARIRRLDSEQTYAGRLERLLWLPPGWLVWRSSGGPSVVAVVRTEACSSTMADEPPRTHRVILVEGDWPAVTGCCMIAAR